MRPFLVRVPHLRPLGVLVAATFALAACGSSSKAAIPPATAPAAATAPSTTTVAPTTTAAGTTSSPTVAVATTKVGKVLVDAKGLTLYRFDGDTAPGATTCTGQCASNWPAATVTGAPSAGPGVDASKLSTFARGDGATQLQIDGHPLYTFAGDAQPGDTNGQGLLGKWYAAGPSGDKVGDDS